MFNIVTCRGKSQLSANYPGINITPVHVTDSSPLVVQANLDAACVGVCISLQSDGTVSAPYN